MNRKCTTPHAECNMRSEAGVFTDIYKLVRALITFSPHNLRDLAISRLGLLVTLLYLPDFSQQIMQI